MSTVLTTTLVFIQSYVSERQQRTKVNNAYSTYPDILYGAPQGSILGPLLISIYISDMFYDIDNCNIASYADDNTTHTSDLNLEEVTQKLQLITNNLFEFKNVIKSWKPDTLYTLQKLRWSSGFYMIFV